MNRKQAEKMSKKKKSKKRKRPIEKKKKSHKKTIIALVCTAVAAALLITGGIVLDRMTNPKYYEFVGYTMQSKSGYDKSGKKIDLRNVYQNAERYDNYHGTLLFNEDKTFHMSMGPGPDDGTNEGTYDYNIGENIIKAKYKSGKKINFKIVRNKDGTIKHIEAPYEKYIIYFR